MDTDGVFLLKQPGPEADHSFKTSAELPYTWSYVYFNYSYVFVYDAELRTGRKLTYIRFKRKAEEELSAEGEI